MQDNRIQHKNKKKELVRISVSVETLKKNIND